MLENSRSIPSAEGRSSIIRSSLAISIRFGAIFGQSAETWRGIHFACDFRTLANDLHKRTGHSLPGITDRPAA
jgi:hypothetical protein